MVLNNSCKNILWIYSRKHWNDEKRDTIFTIFNVYVQGAETEEILKRN